MRAEGKLSQMTLPSMKELESLGFELEVLVTAWEDRLSELADYREIHGHCNVPKNYSAKNYSENLKLANWFKQQRQQYKLRLAGKKSFITLPRIQALESLGFEWKPSISRRQGTPKIPSLVNDATRVRERAVESPGHIQQHSLKKISAVKKSAAIKSTTLSNPTNPTGMAKSISTSSRAKPKKIKRVEAGDARFEETDLDGQTSMAAAKPSLYSNKQASKSLSPDESAPSGDSVDSATRKNALQAKLPWRKPANSRQGTSSQLETAPSNEMFMANPVAAEAQFIYPRPLAWRWVHPEWCC
jgi:hypothetical protein